MSSIEAKRREEASAFVKATETWAAVTSEGSGKGRGEPSWWPDIMHGKPIGRAQWLTVIGIAGMVAKEVDWIGWPIPGADPRGFTWLTWANHDESRRVAVQVHASKAKKTYAWERLLDGTKSYVEAD